MQKSFEDFSAEFISKYPRLFDSELGSNGQFDDLIDAAYMEYLGEENYGNYISSGL